MAAFPLPASQPWMPWKPALGCEREGEGRSQALPGRPDNEAGVPISELHYYCVHPPALTKSHPPLPGRTKPGLPGISRQDSTVQ